MATARPIFDDVIVSATSLNRRSGEILDQALEKCVTIMRNDQAFVLLQREQAAGMTAMLRSMQQLLDIFHAMERVRSGAALDSADEFEWIAAFSADDLQAMANELYSASVRVRRGELDIDEVDAVIHEWQESAWALRSADHRAAFNAEADEVDLTEPVLEPTVR